MSEANQNPNTVNSNSNENLNSDDHGGGNLMFSKPSSFASNRAYIEIHGGNRNKQKLVKDAARWMLGHTLGKRQANYIELEINLVDTLKETNFIGEVMWEDDNIRPRIFSMDLCNHITDRRLLRVLAHEIVHIRQYVRGDMKDYVRSAAYSKWKNKLIQIMGKGSVSYYDYPWEIEARREEGKILKAYCDETGTRFKRSSGKVYYEDRSV